METKKLEDTGNPSVCLQTKAIFCNWKCILVMLAGTMFTFSNSIAFTHLAAYAETCGMDLMWESLLLSIVGAGSFGM